MKIAKKISLFMCSALIGAASIKSVAQTKPNFTINGSFKDMAEIPAKVYLVYSLYLHQPADSAIVKNGTYKISGYTEDVTGAELSLSPTTDANKPAGKATLILDKGELNVVSTGAFNQITVTGSGAAAYNEFNAILKKDREEIAEIVKVMKTDRYQTDEEFKKTTNSRYYYLFSSSLNTLIVYSRANPKSPVTPYVTYVLLSSGFVTPTMRDTLVENLSPAVMQGRIGREIAATVEKQKMYAKEAAEKAEAKRKAIDEKLPIGSKALEFTMNNTEGKPVSLSSFKGKYVLIDFWASWCVPCRGENPNVVKAYETYKGKGFTVLGVSLDAQVQKNAWLAAIKKDGLTWTQLSDLSGWKNAAAKLYMVESIPQNFLIDPNGIIIAKNLRGEELQQKLASLLNK